MAHAKRKSAFIQLAHVGFHEGIDTFAHGVLRLHRPYVAELCGEDRLLHQQNPIALENSLNALEALQVGFKSVLRSHCMQLDTT